MTMTDEQSTNETIKPSTPAPESKSLIDQSQSKDGLSINQSINQSTIHSIMMNANNQSNRFNQSIVMGQPINQHNHQSMNQPNHATIPMNAQSMNQAMNPAFEPTCPCCCMCAECVTARANCTDPNCSTCALKHEKPASNNATRHHQHQQSVKPPLSAPSYTMTPTLATALSNNQPNTLPPKLTINPSMNQSGNSPCCSPNPSINTPMHQQSTPPHQSMNSPNNQAQTPHQHAVNTPVNHSMSTPMQQSMNSPSNQSLSTPLNRSMNSPMGTPMIPPMTPSGQPMSAPLMAFSALLYRCLGNRSALQAMLDCGCLEKFVRESVNQSNPSQAKKKPSLTVQTTIESVSQAHNCDSARKKKKSSSPSKKRKGEQSVAQSPSSKKSKKSPSMDAMPALVRSSTMPNNQPNTQPIYQPIGRSPSPSIISLPSPSNRAGKRSSKQSGKQSTKQSGKPSRSLTQSSAPNTPAHSNEHSGSQGSYQLRDPYSPRYGSINQSVNPANNRPNAQSYDVERAETDSIMLSPASNFAINQPINQDPSDLLLPSFSLDPLTDEPGQSMNQQGIDEFSFYRPRTLSESHPAHPLNALSLNQSLNQGINGQANYQSAPYSPSSYHSGTDSTPSLEDHDLIDSSINQSMNQSVYPLKSSNSPWDSMLESNEVGH